MAPSRSHAPVMQAFNSMVAPGSVDAVFACACESFESVDDGDVRVTHRISIRFAGQQTVNAKDCGTMKTTRHYSSWLQALPASVVPSRSIAGGPSVL